MSEHTTSRRARLVVAAAVLACASLAIAQPRFGNPSPTAGSETSEKANASADQAMYEKVQYVNASRKGPALVVIPGEIKSNNAGFLQKYTSNNIADFGELELSQANFQVLERSNLGPVMKEFELAYNLGDPDAARKFLRMGKLKATRYVVKFDILKAEQVAAAQKGFDGRALAKGQDVAHVHVRHIWPMPKNMAGLLKGFGKIIVPEMNMGQLKTVLRDQYLVDAQSLTKVSGHPFRIAEIEAAIERVVG
jgi:pyruvate/2-oxoacid:ferredoxin oxidoreductase alpha subunit